MNSSESAEQFVKLALEGTEVMLKITGKGAERLAVFFYSMNKNKTKILGIII